MQQELNPSRVEFATLALYVGLILGASVWGTLADVIGRKLSYNVRLLLPLLLILVFTSSAAR